MIIREIPKFLLSGILYKAVSDVRSGLSSRPHAVFFREVGFFSSKRHPLGIS